MTWKRESNRHSLASRGIKTNADGMFDKLKLVFFNELTPEAKRKALNNQKIRLQKLWKQYPDLYTQKTFNYRVSDATLIQDLNNGKSKFTQKGQIF